MHTGSGNYTAASSLISSTNANAMYNPGSDKYFWLASPSADSSYAVMHVHGYYSYVSRYSYNGNYAFCPLVSLKSSVKLTLTD